jgi:hypothetical protein
MSAPSVAAALPPNGVVEAFAASSTVCVVCTALHCGAPLCVECLSTFADAVPPLWDDRVESPRDRERVRVAVANTLSLARETVRLAAWGARQ